jgi:pimeloyl-ACP methyl ester carboxylesterase
VTTTVETAAPARKRRRWLRPLIITLSVLLVLALGGLTAAGWYFSGEVLNVDHSADEYDLTVTAVDETTVTLPLGKATERPGTWGLQWEDGQAVLGEVVSSDATTVTRTLETVLFGELIEGTAARIDKWTFRGDPKTGLGLDFTTVDVPTDLGDAPAWLVPAEGRTWAITVHGRNASPTETLRAVGTYHDLGYPVLAVTYRNDEGAPAAPNGLHSLGQHESDDVLDAIDYALANGAEDVILHGWSMGGATVAVAARKLAETGAADAIRGMVLDSPALDWNSTLDMQAADRDVIPPITWAAKRIVEFRADIDFSELDQRNYAGEFDMPMLLFVDTADETVDHRATLEFAELLQPETTTVVESSSGHCATWNEDPAAYAAALATYLNSL